MRQDTSVRSITVDGTPQLARVIHALHDAGVAITRGPTSFDIACPAHNDNEPSCTVSDGDRGVALFCHAGCDQNELFLAAVEVTGLRAQDFFYRSTPGPLATSSEPLTIGALAGAKRLSPAFLISLGVWQSPQGLRIPYWDETGNRVATRIRHALVAREGSCWERGAKVSPYGAWRVPSFRGGQTLFIVEGETDCWTAWHHLLPAVGIPGKAHARSAFSNAPGLLREFREIVVLEEPDDRTEGELVQGVRRALSDAGSMAQLFVMRLPVKDVSELHLHVQCDPEAFIREFDRAHQIARDSATWDPPGPVPPSALRVARWVKRTEKFTFTIRNVRDGSGLPWSEVRSGLAELVTAGWLREVPRPRRPGRPSREYRPNPHLL
jgi:hypothetical protein